tara:strand:- start:59 stop:1291 length:1233 start_codon:yes stop_codon:yes gene_type:complete
MEAETNSEEIDVKKTMEKIQGIIRKKKEQKIYSKEDTEIANQRPFLKNKDPWTDIDNCLTAIDQCWDPRKDSPITSHRKTTGHLIISIKNVMRKILNFFRIPHILLSRQAEFNFQVLKLLNQLTIILPVQSNPLSEKIKEMRQENLLLKQRLDRILSEVIKKNDLSDTGAAILVREKEHIIDHNYFLFENKFRGKQIEIKKRLEVYLPIFKESDNVLDIGCGRGEFIEILQKENIKVKGIDLNEDMVFTCKEKKLDIEQIDAVTYLSSVNDVSLGGIFASHVIEHFNRDVLLEFINLCYSRLKNGAPIVFETPNPLSVVVSATNFHLDLSHNKPLHPEAIKFLLETNGFVDVKIKYLSPFPEEVRLQLLKDFPDASKKKSINVLNQNIQKLNNLLYGYQDYAVIAKKQKS